DLEFTQLANRLGQVDLALVHLDAQLFELALDVAGGHGAVELFLLAHFHLEGEMHVREPRRLRLGGGLLGGALFGETLALVGDLFLVGFGRRIGESLGQQKIAGVAVLHLHDLTQLAEMLHVRPQNDLHRLSPQVVLDRCRSRASARRRRYWYHVSVMPRVHSPGSTNNSGTASAAAAAAAITSATADTPNASAKVATIAAPRSAYNVPATSPTLAPATCSAPETGRI